jgi:integrase
MTGRPRLAVGETGMVRYRPVPAGWQAVANHRDTDGRVRQYARSAATKSAARAALYKHVAEQLTTTARVNRNTPVDELAEEYFARLKEDVDHKVISPGTLRLYRGHWNNYGKPALGKLRIGEVDVQCIDRFLRELRNHSPTVAKSMRAVLSGMFGAATTWQVIPANPVRDASRIRQGGGKAAVALEPEQVADLLERLGTLAQMPGKFRNHRFYRTTLIPPDIPDLVLWMLGTSLRIGQAIATHWPNIDFDAGTAAVGPNIIRIKGEGLRINRGTSKTKEQKLGLPAVVVEMLRRRRRVTRNPLGPVFPGAFGELRDPCNVAKELRRALDLAEYPWVTSHTFRKTVATVLDDAGLSARQIADQLSHSRPSMTQDVYMKRNARNSRQVAALDMMFGTDPQQRVVPLDPPTQR